jgi:hypothetical protein
MLSKKLSIPQIICVACIIGDGICNIRTGMLNFADMSITFGAIFLILFQYFEDK